MKYLIIIMLVGSLILNVKLFYDYRTTCHYDWSRLVTLKERLIKMTHLDSQGSPENTMPWEEAFDELIEIDDWISNTHEFHCRLFFSAGSTARYKAMNRQEDEPIHIPFGGKLKHVR